MNREIKYYKHYFIDFYNSLDLASQRKIAYVLQYIKTEQRWNEKFVKFIRDGLFELRASHNGNIYRVFLYLTMETLSYFSMVFKRRVRRLRNKKSKKQLI